MITAISTTHTTYTTGTPGNPGAQAEIADARNRELRTAASSDNTGTQASTSSDPNAQSSGLPAEQRVSAGQRVSDADRQLINELASRDREVRNHERAHQAAGGNLTGSAGYTYQLGPDGRRYAVGGEVSISAPVPSGDAKADLEKAQTILRAALAPAEPSTQDLRVAASARSLAADAQAELVTERARQANETVESSGDSEQQEDIVESQGREPVDSRPDAPATPQTTRNDSSSSPADATRSAVDQADETTLSVAERFEQRRDEEEQNRALREQQQIESEQRAQRLAEYQQDMAQLQQRLAEVNQMLAQAGVLDAEYLVGSYINDNA